MKRDSLDEALRRKLHDVEAGLPVPPWAEMQRRMQLHANAHPAERVPLFRSWSRYAAAAVVLLGIGLGVWRVQRTHSWGEKSMAETVALPLPVSGSDSASRTAPAFNDTALNRIMKSARSVRLIDPRSKASTALLASLSDGAGAPSGNSSPSRDNTDNASATGSDMSSQPDRSAETAPNRELIAAYERKFAQTDAPLKRRGGRSKGWSASLYANASTFSNALSASGSSPMLLIQNAGLADIGSMRVESPVFEDSHMDHKFPVSVGFSVHKYLTPRLHIGTGLVYTYMSSKAEIEGAFNYRYRQRLHYLGIPLTVNYSVFDRGRFDIYFSGGAMAEFALSARGTTELYKDRAFVSSETCKIAADGALWSVNLGLGVGFDLVDHFGIYVEPAVSYYFENKRQPASYRTQNPWNVNLGVGFRYKF